MKKKIINHNLTESTHCKVLFRRAVCSSIINARFTIVFNIVVHTKLYETAKEVRSK